MGELDIARLAAYFVRRRSLEALFQLSFPSLLSWLVLEKYCTWMLSEHRRLRCHSAAIAPECSFLRVVDLAVLSIFFQIATLA